MRRRRILLVEDREDNARALSVLLSAAGYEVVVTNTGTGALEAAEAEHPDAVLLDLGLPDLSGYEVCRRLRRRPWARSLLLIAVTGWTRESDRVEAYEAGFDYFILKPATFDTLDALLQGVDRRAGNAGAAARAADDAPSPDPSSASKKIDRD